MKVKKYLLMIGLAVCMLSGCGKKESAVDQKINDREGNFIYSTVDVSATETKLQLNSQAECLEGKHLDFSTADEDMYVGIYSYDGNTYTAGYAKNCDFKEYLLLPNIQGAEAAQIGGVDYQVAYYSDNVKAAYYYEDDDTCVFVYTDVEMGSEEFKKQVEELDIHIEGEV